MLSTPLQRLWRPLGAEWWAWLVPVVVAGFIYETKGRPLERAVGGLVGLAIVVFAARKPEVGITTLVVGLPFQGLLLAQLYTWGLPASIVRPLGSWKEALAIGVVIAGARGLCRRRQRLDALDWLGLAYVAVIGVYALFPEFFASNAPTEGDVRSLAFRASAGFVLLLLGARHAELREGFASRIARVVMIVGVVVSVIAIYEYAFSDSWNDFVVNRVQFPRYQLDILDVIPFNSTDIRYYGHLGGAEYVRVGSVLLSPLTLGFYLLAPFAVAMERVVRHGMRSSSGVALATIGGALIMTQTRAAIIGAIIVAFTALRPAAGRSRERRLQFGMILAVLVIVALPAATATGLSDRSTSAAAGDEKSATDHVEAFWNGIDVITEHPLGLGVGTSAGTGARFNVQGTTITENYYLQVGVEVGIIGMAVFIAMTIALLRRLRRAADAVSDLGVSAIRGAGVGLVIGAFFLHTWENIPVAWTFWVLAGTAIGIAERAGGGAHGEMQVPTPAALEPGPGRLD